MRNRPTAQTLALTLLAFCLAAIHAQPVDAQAFKSAANKLIQDACVHCHDDTTETGLDLSKLSHDLADADTFRSWVKVYDRVESGEMPPASEERPDAAILQSSLKALKNDLYTHNANVQSRVGRVPARRLTKREFGYTLRDLLLIDGDVTSGLPDEVESGTFDTVGVNQRLSAVHMESYLTAADEALEVAIQQGDNPYRESEASFGYLDEWHDKPLALGGSVTRPLLYGKGYALFTDVDYLTAFQFNVQKPGMHRLTMRVAAYQAKKPLTMKLIMKSPGGGATIIKSHDLVPGRPETITVETYMQPGNTAYLTLDMEGPQVYADITRAGGSRKYKGRGLAVMQQKVEGPIYDAWPPESTTQLSLGADSKERDSYEGVSRTLQTIGARVFRRPLSDGELKKFADLAKPAIASGRAWPVKVPLRAMLSSPQFLIHDTKPGKLDDYALANRLSYFLWKSMPDDQLFAVAKAGTLSDADVLDTQIERMLADEKSQRFISDFLGQWLRVYQVNATTPDDKLYPEYDELLGLAMPKETELFFNELLSENLSITNMIDSDFTFVNRRLAKHYNIPDIEGQDFRKVTLPADSSRGGILTQAAILKTTANGTVTSPVTRGNFVLTSLLGTPPSPPPPGIGSIEPDTRGKTTIRETLAAHRDIETCNKCHREIDPPGFALESFDPIGGFRTNYRASSNGRFFSSATYKHAMKVDASGVTADGKSFSGIQEFKQLLMREKKQFARNFISQLVAYSTGAEVQFADREEIEQILQQASKNDFRLRDIIHQVVQSQLFRNK